MQIDAYVLKNGLKLCNLLDFHFYFYVLMKEVFSTKESCVLLTLRCNILSLQKSIATLELDF